MAKSKGGISLATARMSVFGIWVVILLIYVSAFLLMSGKPGIDPSESDEAAWTAAYIMLPVVIAFATFYLSADSKDRLHKERSHRIAYDQFGMAIGITLLCHGIVLLYFAIRVWFGTFDFDNDTSKSFASLTRTGFKWLLFWGLGPIIAVNFLLGRKDVGLGQSPSQGK